MKLTTGCFFQLFNWKFLDDRDLTIIGILIAIFTVIITILFGIPVIRTARAEREKRRQKQQTLFKESGWLTASALAYSSLDYVRTMQREMRPTSQRLAIEKIRNLLDERKEVENGNHILLVGPSLSGKSHITISILADLSDAYVLVPDETAFNQASNEGYGLPKAPDTARYKIVLLDNFHEFFKGSSTTPKALIHKAIHQGFILWVNCISIEEYARVKSFLDFKEGPLGLFREIVLDEKLSTGEANEIAKSWGRQKVLPTFNGLIGEIVYPPADMSQHYEDLKSDALALDVLIFIKQAYMLGAFTLPYRMKLELIKKVYTKKYSSDYIPLMEALKKIEQKGFITLLNDHTLFSFDSVWLNEIVEPKMKAKDFFLYWNDVLPKNLILYTNLMVSTKDYSEVLAYHKEMEAEEIIGNIRTYAILISRSPNYETALEWYRKIDENKANEFIYTALMSRSPSYKIALEWFEKMGEAKANDVVYNLLIHLSPDYETALMWYANVKNRDVITYNSLINHSRDYATALKWYREIKKGEATVITYTSLIYRSPDYKTALEWFEEIRKEDVNEIVYNALILRASNYDVALEWFHKIEKAKRNEIICGSLIYRSPHYEVAVDWFNTFENEKPPVESHTYFALMRVIGRTRNRGSYQLAVGIHDEMLEKGIASNTVIFNFLIRLAPDFDRGFKLLEMMVTHKDNRGNPIAPDKYTRTAIERKAYGNPGLLNRVHVWFTDYFQKRRPSKNT